MTDWRAVLGYANGNTLDNVRRKYKKLALQLHPNKGGTTAGFQALQAAMERAEQNLAGGGSSGGGASGRGRRSPKGTWAKRQGSGSSGSNNSFTRRREQAWKEHAEFMRGFYRRWEETRRREEEAERARKKEREERERREFAARERQRERERKQRLDRVVNPLRWSAREAVAMKSAVMAEVTRAVLAADRGERKSSRVRNGSLPGSVELGIQHNSIYTSWLYFPATRRVSLEYAESKSTLLISYAKEAFKANGVRVVKNATLIGRRLREELGMLPLTALATPIMAPRMISVALKKRKWNRSQGRKRLAVRAEAMGEFKKTGQVPEHLANRYDRLRAERRPGWIYRG